MVSASSGWLMAFDNISSLPDWLSDALCRLSTGGGFSIRQLYTDADEILFDAMRPSILNGISDPMCHDDWSCPDQTRLTVTELAEAFHRPTSHVYQLTRTKAIPHLKLDGHIVFIASELRMWMAEREERIVLQKSVPITCRTRRTA